MAHDSFQGRFHQLGYVARSLERGVARLVEQMGATVAVIKQDPRDAEGNFMPLQSVAMLDVPGAQLEVIQPRLDWPSIYLDHLPVSDDDVRFHHIAFMMDSDSEWVNGVSHFNKHDIELAWGGATAALRFAYFDTRAQCGHFSELLFRR